MIHINLKYLTKLQLSPNQYSIVYAIATSTIPELLKAYKPDEVDLLVLETRGYILKSSSANTLLQLNEECINNCLKACDLSDKKITWLNDWLELWPTGVKSGGYYVKGDINGVNKKMKAFVKDNSFAPNDIMNATREYLNEKEKHGWKGIQLAHHFISKEQNSNLKTYCENLGQNTQPDDFSTNV